MPGTRFATMDSIIWSTLAFPACSQLGNSTGGNHTIKVWLLQSRYADGVLPASLCEVGHKDLFYDPTTYLKR